MSGLAKRNANRTSDFLRLSRVASSTAHGIDIAPVEKDDVLLARRPRFRRDVEAEALERIEQERAAHLERGGAAADAVVDGDRPRLRGRQPGMRRNHERDEGMPLGV